MAFLPRFFNGGTHTITSTLAQYDPTTPLPPSIPDIFINFFHGMDGRVAMQASRMEAPSRTAAIDMAAIDRAVHCSAAPSVFIFAIFSGMQSEKSDGQRRERGGRGEFFSPRHALPLSISTTDLRIQHISLEVLSFSRSVWERASAKISAAPRKRFARSAVLSSIPTISISSEPAIRLHTHSACLFGS